MNDSDSVLNNANTLPIFPNFQPLSLDQKVQINNLTASFEPYSDFNFSNLWAWDIDGSSRVTTLNGNLVYRLTDYDKDIRFCTFLGMNDINQTSVRLLEYAKESGIEPQLMLIPEVVANKITAPHLLVTEDRDSNDYILSVDDLVEFNASHYGVKRNLLRKFNQLYGDQAKVSYSNLHNQNDDLVDLFAQWQHSRNKRDADVQDELTAFKRMLGGANYFDAQILRLFIDDKLVAYSVFEVVSDNMAVIHYDKALTEFKGIYEFTKHCLAKRLADMNIHFINYEQDLGIEGLRRSKESYHPKRYLKKYIVSIGTKD